jgi:hypothetical protein
MNPNDEKSTTSKEKNSLHKQQNPNKSPPESPSTT